jgi:hypothetical protein
VARLCGESEVFCLSLNPKGNAFRGREDLRPTACPPVIQSAMGDRPAGGTGRKYARKSVNI